MTYQFTDAQLAEISKLHEEALATGFYSVAYARVAEMVATEPDATGAFSANDDPEVLASQIWLLGASQATAGEGIFSELIRASTVRQWELHFGPDEPMPEGLIQEASNKVADSVLRNILDDKILPSIDSIAENDAEEVGLTIFEYRPDGTLYDDTAYLRDSAWSGCILFSVFNGSGISSDQGWRLVGEDDGALTDVNDLRDLIFAYDAFSHAFNSTRLQFVLGASLESGPLSYDAAITDIFGGASNQITDLGIFNLLYAHRDGIADLVTPDAETFILNATNGGTAHNELAFVATFGPEYLVDRLLTLFDEAPATSTTQANFVERAHQLFSGIKERGQLDLSATRIDELVLGSEPDGGQQLPTETLVDLAKQDTAAGKAVRYALVELSPVVIFDDSGELYANFEADDISLDERYSDEYLTDRARMLSQLFVDGAGTESGEPDTAFRDMGNGITAGARPFQLVDQVAFASDRGGQLMGSDSGEDSLYGGQGQDVLYGLA